MANQNNIRLIAFGILGMSLGFFFSCLYLILYYGTVYSEAVSDTARSNSALQISTIIFLTIGVTFYVVYHRKAIMESFVVDKDSE